MAGGTVKPDDGNTNNRNAMFNADPRVVHLEGRVERVEGDVRDIKTGVQKLLDRPQNPGFSQVLTTLVSTLAFCSFIFAFAEWRLGQSLAPVKADITVMQTKADWAADSVHAAKVQAAVLEERMAWIRAAQQQPGKPPQ
jgi:hypothetical protein